MIEALPTLEVGERIHVPVHAHYNLAHERSDSEEEIKFQITWSKTTNWQPRIPDSD